MCSFIAYCHICLLDINGDMAFSKVKRTDSGSVKEERLGTGRSEVKRGCGKEV